MASGRVNRTKRPNTWLHRPMLQTSRKLLLTRAVHTWHKVDLLRSHTDVRLLRQTGKHLLRVSFSPSDP